MSRSSSPATHWDQLETWLNAVTGTILTESARDLQRLSREQLDEDLNRLMAHDPTQSYSSKELAKIVGALAHNLVAQVKLSDGNITLLEQEATALKLQTEEARRNQADAENRVEQLTRELQEEVERLQEALSDLRIDAEQRDQEGELARQGLENRLQQAETLLERAEVDLKEREAKAKAFEKHCKAARAEAQTLAQQQEQLKAEFDAVQRELNYAYQFTADQSSTEPPPTSKPRLLSQASEDGEETPLFKRTLACVQGPLAAAEGGGPLPRTPTTTHGLTPKDIDKLARNIPTFTPDPAGGHDVHAYLQDIDFHLQTVANVSIRDRLYLIRITSSQLTLEGAQPQYHARSFNRDTRDFTASRERGDYRGARPKHRTDRQGHGSRSSGDPQSKAAWEGPRQPRSHRPAKMRAAGPQSHQGTATQGPSDKPKPQLPSEQTESPPPRTAPQIPANDATPSLGTASLISLPIQGLDVQNPLQSTTVHLKQVTAFQPITEQDPEVPESAVLVVCLPTEQQETIPNCPPVTTQTLVPSLLGNLIEKGVARRLYLAITLEHEVRLEALVDTGADLTLMSSQLFHRLLDGAKRQSRTLKPQKCALNVQSYSQTEVQLQQIAPIHLTIGPMSLVHPVYISPMDFYPLLIGKDLLDRFEPLMDFKRLKIWAQVREPLPFPTTNPAEVQCQVTEVSDPPPAGRENTDSGPTPSSEAPLCTLEPDQDPDTYCPRVREVVHLNHLEITDTILALWADNSAISLKLFTALTMATPDIPYAAKTTRFPLDYQLPTFVTAKRICVLNLKWNGRSFTHPFLVLQDSPHELYLGADILVRLQAHIDTINDVVWAPLTSQLPVSPFDHTHLVSGQTIPEVCTLVNELETTVPAYTKGVAVRLNLRRGQTLNHTLAYFQPSPECAELGLTLEATPLTEVTSRAVYILFNNCTATPIRLPRGYRAGWLISQNFHDLELTIPVIGPIPPPLTLEGSPNDTVFTAPFSMVAITSIMPMTKEQVCRTEMTKDCLSVYTVSCQPTCEVNEITAPVAINETNDATMEEPYPGFEAQVQQILKDADAIQDETDLQKLRQILYQYKASFAKDSLDCGLTHLHTVRIPSHPNAPPTFVKQYKIPIASHESVQDIIDSMLEKGIIRPCNSTYSAPIWPVLKPNGKWRPTIDYRKLNQQVPLSRWPMTQLEQEIPRIRGATIFSTLDVASGFWTIPVHPEDQHKLAFTFGNRQYTFTRCPFGYANSPAEFNIFLNKACPDARMRGNLIYVDDVLMKSATVDDHLEEIKHVLNQLTTAGAKIALHKGQWCKNKVNYVGLLIGPHGIEPQSSRIQAVQNIKAPKNISELRSFLGVCNYSRQFIENYSDIARPLTSLLKKDCPFLWTDAQDNAVQELKRHLCSAPCLAYPNPQKEFYLEAGFSNHCLSAGLYQRYDQDKRVVAYASKTLLPPELKYTDCEKALLCTVWAIQRFSNYIGAQKVIIETCHQPVTFLNSQRIRDGVVTNARIATWLMALQGRDIEARYAQNHRSALGNGLAACQNCSGDTPTTTLEPEEPQLLQQPTFHRYFEENVCQGMPTAYIDGCSYNHQGNLQAGAGVLWVDNNPCPPQHFKLGPQSSQYAEVAAVLITLQIAATHNIKELLICTDSNYARLSFTCHLPNWIQNGYRTANNKPVKHQHLFRACDTITREHDMLVYWKKVKGHSKQPGQDKDFNDQTDALAKAGAQDGDLWSPPPQTTTPAVVAITRSRRRATSTEPASQAGSLTPQIANGDLVSLQASDTSILTMLNHLKDPSSYPIASTDLTQVSGLKRLHHVRHLLRVTDNILWYVPDDRTTPKLVVPQCLRGVMLMYAHDTPCAGHHGIRATYEALKIVAYWPGMHQDATEYVKGCLVCCQFQPANANHKAPLQHRGTTFPWSDLQIDWVGPLPRSTRGNKYFLTVVCQFTKWVECLPAPNDTAQTTACLLMNHVFSRFGLPLRVNSDRGTHFTAEIMQEIWKLLGIQAQLHISFHPIASGQVERANRSVVSMLKKFVASNQKDWDVKLPLVLMAIRATPSQSTGVPPFELMTGRQMTLPLHLLYQPGDSNLVTAYTTHQYLEELQRHLRTTFAFAQQQLQKSAEGRKAYYDQKASREELDVGDKVWYYRFAPPQQTGPHRLSKKLLPHWTGPYEIVDKLSPVAYRIKISRGQTEPTLKWVHRNQIKRHWATGREGKGGANSN
ncbi:hypothetical protein QQF64_009102 [Cirrhinus molitorella]|uniref:Gypsy retrotransposon integrase-like protein 1 n=1 Tax=Cirrhinus molitorella TaxID=172907 RepID=A0ABR3M147_9TELE